MLDKIAEQPGLLFVAATLLPLASFVLILLSNGLWALARRYREQAAGAALYNALGREMGGRVPAYVALAAIGLACVLSVTGLVWYVRDHGKYLHATEKAEDEVAEARKRAHAAEKAVEKAEEEVAKAKKGKAKKALEAAEGKVAEQKKLVEEAEKQQEKAEDAVRDAEKSWQGRRAAAWQGRFDWVRLRPAGLNDPDRATVLQLGYNIDTLAALMFAMVTFIASLIHLYSIGYMSAELSEEVEDHAVHGAGPHFHRRGRFGRFFLYLSLFCFSMLNLVLADNLFQVFVSWELVGVCSYLLIGFYFERQTASDAANKAFITNRVGDAGFIIGLVICWTFLGTLNFEDMFKQVRHPYRDADGEVAKRAGQIVRGEPTTVRVKGGQEAPAVEVKEPGQGSQALLFPTRPIMGESKGHEHFHSAEAGDKPATPANRGPTDHGSMPYWLLVVAGLGIFLGCVGKSAQFPLQVWLPDAMEGPTPVSALIHAATMVAAGVYLVGRCYPLFTLEVLLTIAYVGGITLFVAATIAVVMTDIKKVLAYSTVSQLGYMMLALGIGGWVAGLFHLITHAFFKALLFLGSGSVIYGCHHEQEMTRMGGLYPKMKVTALTMLAGVLAIAGIPLFSGWYSKDSIVAQAMGYITIHPGHALLFLLPLMTAGITTFYMFRMWFMTFTGKPRDHHVFEHAHESPWTMTVPLVLLAVFAIGVAWGWPVWDATKSHLEHHVRHAEPLAVRADFGKVGVDPHKAHVGEGEGHEEAEGARAGPRTVETVAHERHHLAGYLALGAVALGIVFASLLYLHGVLDPAEAKEQFPRVYDFLVHKWYFDEAYSALFVRPALIVGRWCKSFDLLGIDGVLHAIARATVWVSRLGGKIDNYIVDGLVNLVADTTFAIGAKLRGIQTGALRNYVLFLVLAAVGIFVALTYFVALATAG
jgi:NADH-quinone oxidoreductase subunit L